MGVSGSRELSEILDRVREWPPTLRISLARQILESVEDATDEGPPPRRIPLGRIFGLLKTDTPPPTDEEVSRIIEEERMRKFG